MHLKKLPIPDELKWMMIGEYAEIRGLDKCPGLNGERITLTGRPYCRHGRWFVDFREAKELAFLAGNINENDRIGVEYLKPWEGLFRLQQKGMLEETCTWEEFEKTLGVTIARALEGHRVII